MKSHYLSPLSAFFELWPARIRPWRWPIWLSFIALTAVAGVGLPRIDLDDSVDAYFRDDEPVKQAYDRFRALFGSDEVLYLVYEARDGNVFSRRSLAAVMGLQDALWGAPRAASAGNGSPLDHITDVETIANASYLEADASILLSRDFVEALPETKADEARLCQLALHHPDYPLLLVSADGRYGGIIIRTDFNARSAGEMAEPGPAPADFRFEEQVREEIPPQFVSTMMAEYVPFTRAVHAIAEQAEYTDALTFYYAGSPEFRTFVVDVVMQEMGLILIGSLLLSLLVLALLFRSASAVVWPLVIVAVTTVWTLGSIGWSGVPTADTVNIMVFLLIAVGIADSVHILSGYLLFRQRGAGHARALGSVFAKSGFACLLTSLTTAAGLLAMTLVPLVSMQRFGVFAALGVLYAFLLTAFMLPLMLDLWSPQPRPQLPEKPARVGHGLTPNLLAWIERLGARRPVALLVVAGLLLPVLLGGFCLIRVDSNTITIFGREQTIRRDYDLIDETMGGTGNLEVVVDTGVENGHKDPAVLYAIEGFQHDLLSDEPDTVRKALSIVNIAKESYRVLNGGDRAWYVLPDRRDTLSQTLVLFDGANPEDRRRMVADDYSASRITVVTRNLSSSEMVALMQRLAALATDHFGPLTSAYPDLGVTFTGQIPLFMQMMSDMSWSQIKSFGVTLAVVSLLLLGVFGSLRSGVIAIVPNLLPVASVFAVMGYAGIPLDLHTLLVIPIIIGIAVDDTIHFLSRFQLEFVRTGDTDASIRRALEEAGPAIIFTSVVLAIGYLVFLASVNKGFNYFGILSSIAILTATVADLLLLPALLRLVYAGGHRPRQHLRCRPAVRKSAHRPLNRRLTLPGEFSI